METPATAFPLTDRFIKALTLAHKWHTGQYRKGTRIPYISHLMGVASVALEFGASEDEAIAALLHDALEDGPENLEPEETMRAKKRQELEDHIRREFDTEVARLVLGATEETPLVNGRKAPWEQRKGEYLHKLVSREHVKDASALLVSAADKLHNARSILTDVLTAGDTAETRAAFFDRFNQGQHGTLQYYRLLVRAYRLAPGAAGQPRLLALIAELDRTVTALEAACDLDQDTVAAFPLLRPVGEQLA
ncbi:HD domain-containing protein [Deinococcus aerophilus]|uniref:HD/PDEase domain-containing protein n=1 Tax=Deinococcus aerophilus TaxID=522488 RepID=A0ABQ2GQL3_9DEIO|nr:HD domain-containing protein [Deinococcus aerophilus]GGM06651.1 hypothetical protein GCM10010841_13600 [Deinococcus aerophilus]